MIKPIAISLSPNTEKDDVLLALKTVLQPLQWFNFRHTENFEHAFAQMFGKEYWALAVNSGRSALFLIIKSLNLNPSDKVALQAFTCVAVPNSVKWAGARPVYVDVDETFNMDPEDLERKLNRDVKALIIQHSFGIPANIDVIKKIAKKRKIYLIEDCAISLGASFKGKKVGTFGDIAFFSTGRDKVVSSVFGGVIVGRSKETYEKLRDMRDILEYPTPTWFLQQAMHPILFSLILPLYNFGLGKFGVGKLLLFVFQKMHVLTKPVSKDEEYGFQPKEYPKKMPGGLAVLALHQLKKLEKFNKHRKVIAEKYFSLLNRSKIKLPLKNQGAIWLRFPILIKNRNEIFNKAKAKGVLLGEWYKGVIDPTKEKYRIEYSLGTCPKAEEYADQILNLPTYPNMSTEEIEKVVKLVNG